MKAQRPILTIVALILFVSLACTTILGTPAPEAAAGVEETNVAPPPPVEKSPTPKEQATEIVPTDTPAASPYFTEEFDNNPANWELVVVPDNPDPSKKSDIESVTTAFSDGRMVFDIPEEWLSAFYTYTGETYKDVRLDIEFDNKGVNSNQVSLVCRSDGGDKSYELEVSNDGRWVFKVNRQIVNRGASDKIKVGKGINHYTMICVDNEISFFFNDVEPKGSPFVDNQNALGAGYVGLVVTAKGKIPVNVEIDWYKISEP